MIKFTIENTFPKVALKNETINNVNVTSSYSYCTYNKKYMYYLKRKSFLSIIRKYLDNI